MAVVLEKDLDSILALPLTEVRIALAQKLLAKKPFDDKARTQILQQLEAAVPDDQQTFFNREKENIRLALKNGRAPNEPNLSTPELQLLWAANLAFAATQSKTPIHQSMLWRQLTNCADAKKELTQHAFYIARDSVNRSTRLRWGAPGSLFSFAPDANRINLDFLFSLVAGFEDTRGAVFHEIGHSKLTRGFTAGMQKVHDEIEALRQKTKTDPPTKLTEDEYLRLAELKIEWKYRFLLLDEAENSVVNRYTINLGRKLSQDYGRSLNIIETAIALPALRALPPRAGAINPASPPPVVDPNAPPKPPTAKQKFINFKKVVRWSLYTNNGFFPNTKEAWERLGVHPDWIEALPKQSGSPAPTSEEAFKDLLALCGGVEGLEHLQPDNLDRMRGPDWLKRMTDDYADRRNVIIDEIWTRYAEPIVEQIKQEAREKAKQDLENKKQGKDQQPSPPSSNQPDSGQGEDDEPDESKGQGDDDDNSPSQDGDDDQGEGQGEGQGKGKGKGKGKGAGGGAGEDKDDSPAQGNDNEPDESKGKDEGEDESPAQSDDDEPGDGKGGKGKNEDESPGQGEGGGKDTGEEDGGKSGGASDDDTGPGDSSDDDDLEPGGGGSGGIEDDDSVPVEGVGDMPAPGELPKTPQEARDRDAKNRNKNKGDDDPAAGKDEGGKDTPAPGENGDEGKNKPKPGKNDAKPEAGDDNPGESIEDLLREYEQGQQAGGQGAGGNKGRLAPPISPRAGGGAGTTNLRSRPNVGDWSDYEKCMTDFKPEIVAARHMLSKIQERQSRVKRKVSRERDLLPEDGDMTRLDESRQGELITKIVTGQSLSEDDARRFSKDHERPIPASIDVVLMADGSDSMYSKTSNTYKTWPFGPIQAAIQAGCILNEGARKPRNPQLRKEGDIDVHTILWGNKTPMIIAEPGMTQKAVGEKIAGLNKGQGWGTNLAPSLQAMTKMLAEKKRKSGSLVGYSHIIIVSDGDIFDPEETKVALERLFQNCREVTVDILVVQDAETNMDKVAKEMVAKHGAGKMGHIHITTPEQAHKATLDLLHQRMSSTGYSKAIPAEKKRKELKRAHESMNDSDNKTRSL